MVDQVRLVNAKHVLEFLFTHQLVSRVQTRRIELDVKRLSIACHQAPPWDHQQKLKYFQFAEKIFTINTVLSSGGASILAAASAGEKEFLAQQHQKT